MGTSAGTMGAANAGEDGGLVDAVGWSPLAGCSAAETCERRVRALVEASGAGLGARHADDWRDKAVRVLRGYFHAASVAYMGVWGLPPPAAPARDLLFAFRKSYRLEALTSPAGRALIELTRGTAMRTPGSMKPTAP